MINFSELPIIVLLNITKHIPNKDLIELSLTNKLLFKIITCYSNVEIIAKTALRYDLEKSINKLKIKSFIPEKIILNKFVISRCIRIIKKFKNFKIW